MYGCERWTIKKADHWRIDAFEWWCWEDSWESLGHQGDQASQSWRKSTLNIHCKDWCWSWSSNILKSQLTGKDPAAGKVWEQEEKRGDRGWDGWMASWSQWTWVWQTLGDSEGQGSLKCCSPWGCKETRLSYWLKNNTKMGFPGGTSIKNPHANAGDARNTGVIPGWARSPAEGNPAEPSILAWRIPWTEEPGGLQSTGPQSQTQLSIYCKLGVSCSLLYYFHLQLLWQDLGCTSWWGHSIKEVLKKVHGTEDKVIAISAETYCNPSFSLMHLHPFQLIYPSLEIHLAWCWQLLNRTLNKTPSNKNVYTQCRHLYSFVLTLNHEDFFTL